MESVVMDNCPADVDENQDAKGSQSAENFQKFLFELFEKNGVMNDLRSYLRGHIVNVLRSAQTGESPSCQKNFTQRLELMFQALNILIAEYLLCLEFSYTLSVFISEIPLANMAFSFAKTLLQKTNIDDHRPRFKDTDVWCILNYLGVKCDSEHATSIVDMYRLEQNSPLLLCILKSATLFKEPTNFELINSSQETITLSPRSSDNEDKLSPQRKPSLQEKCRHFVLCKACQSKMKRVKEKYRKKKMEFAKNMKDSSTNNINVEFLMKNISSMESSLIQEMYDQLKSVYEGEMALMKAEEDRRVQRSLASHSTQLQKRRAEMEESFKAREAELVTNVQRKKQFLWGLARALRHQQTHMARAMRDVAHETNRLHAQEDSLKTQLAEAELVLRQRGEEMKQQISSELVILEGHLESMKRERDSINMERLQLEQYRDMTEKPINNEDLKPHYELLKNELDILKKYLETAKLETKCVIERSTITDFNDVPSKIDEVLNNEQDLDRRYDEEKVKPKQLVNNFKKSKNVNFNQSNLDDTLYHSRSRSRSHSSSSEAGDAFARRDSLQRLADENERLRGFARQQREHIDNLTSQQARLQAELTAGRVWTVPAPTRPSTAPIAATQPHTQRLSLAASVNNLSWGWRQGAGEELSAVRWAPTDHVPFVGRAAAAPTDHVPFVGRAAAAPTDHVPFVGRAAAAPTDHVPFVGRAAAAPTDHVPFVGRAAAAPTDHVPFVGRAAAAPTDHVPFVGRAAAAPSDNRRYLISQWRSLRRRISPLRGVSKPRGDAGQRARERTEPAGPSAFKFYLDRETDNLKRRDKSPKSLLKEAKDNLKSKEPVKLAPTHEKSPNCVLREAKLRLRKLEIEAEAVEQSYLDFRRKQEARDDTGPVGGANEQYDNKTYKDECAKQSTSYQDPSYDYDCYKAYQTELAIAEHFKNKNTAAARLNPIPNAYSTQIKKSENYLDTPMPEFRKFYNPERFDKSRNITQTSEHEKSKRKDTIRQAKHDKVKELEILKQNIGKIYNMPEQEVVETPPGESSIEIQSQEANENNSTAVDDAPVDNANVPTEATDANVLRIEVENVDLKVQESPKENVLLIVESSIDNRDSEPDNTDKISTQMTIILTPKRSPVKERESNTPSPTDNSKSQKKTISGNARPSYSGQSSEISAKLTSDNVVSFYHTEVDESSVKMPLDLFKEVVSDPCELEQNEDPDYPDDFSADVDNYNSRTDDDINSPVSIAKTSDDENFWES